ncbi:hypothetical protein DHB74_06810 [Pseudomonas sp. G11-1]|nr:hypothetical protein [Pseudomonas sp. G11-1]MCO5789283.1 hypothetical protein [Pseudomonas sp. G11-2]
MSIAALVIGSFAVVMSATTINVAIAPMMEEFAISHRLAQSFSSVFLGLTVICAPLAARLADRFGAWRVFARVLLIYLLASVLAGFSDSFSAMLAVRGVQGLCAGILQPLSLFLVLETANPARQGRTLSMFSLGVVMAPALGPTLAGFVVEYTNWRYTFWLGVPPAVLSLGLVAWCRPGERTAAAPGGRLDFAGLGFLAVLVVLVFAWPAVLEYSGWLALGLMLLWAGLVWCFWRRMLGQEQPLIDPELLRHPAYAKGLVVTLVYGIGMYGSIFLIPLLLQDGLGQSAVVTGNLLLLGGLALAASIALSGRLVDRFSSQLVVLIGLGCFALSNLLLAWPGGLWTIALGVIISRFALGMIIPGLYTSMARAVPESMLRRGTAVTTMTRQAGGALGITLIGVLLAALSPSGTANLTGAVDLPYRILFVILTLMFLAALPIARRMGRPPS